MYNKKNIESIKMENITIDDFINELKKCEGIPYHHAGRNEFGLDCVGIIVYVLEKLGLDYEGDLKSYSVLGDGLNLSYILTKNCLNNPAGRENPKVGDILLMSFLKHPQHVAVYLGDRGDGVDCIIHSSNMLNSVKIQPYFGWKHRVNQVYTLKHFI